MSAELGAGDLLSAASRKASVAVLAFAALLSAPSIGYDFVRWDDDRFITGNPIAGAGLGECVSWAVSAPRFESYHPLHLLLLCGEFAVGGAGSSVVYRIVSWVLCAALGWMLARWLIAEGAAPIAAALAGGLVIAHPLLIEVRV